MISIRKAEERGLTEINWLKSYHTFSFGEYHDPEHMGFVTLRVINEDRVKPGQGFGTHQHRDMEIISYVVEGALEHKDSLGTGSIIQPGEIQRMTAGTGVSHSEFNASKQEPVHFLQIWIMPNKTGLAPSYQQKTLNTSTKNEFILIGSQENNDKIITIHQDVNLYLARLTPNESVKYVFNKGRKGWLQLVKGKISLNDHLLNQGDGARITDENNVIIKCLDEAEILLFDLG